MRTSKTKKTRNKIESYDSMKSAAAGMGIPLELLTEAKNLGAPGFRGSRIYATEVRAWLTENPTDSTGGDDSSLIGLRKKFLRTQIAREDFKLAALKGEHIPMAEAREAIKGMVANARLEIRNIENGLPLTLQGLDVPQARLVLQTAFDALCAKIYAPEALA